MLADDKTSSRNDFSAEVANGNIVGGRDESNKIPDMTTGEAPGPRSESSSTTTPTLTGWRLIAVLTAAFLGFFLSLLDTTIVAVALTTISNEFGAFDLSSWVLTAYLITYMAFSIIVSRLSDVFGRKAVELASFVLFAAFSLGCALSRSMIELIVFRALQGIGGSGIYSLAIIIALESFPPQQRGFIAAAVSLVQVVAGVLGPLVGGAFANNRHDSTWRWIFYLNLPICGIAILCLLSWPAAGRAQKTFSKSAFKSIDFLGSALLLTSSVLLIFALQQGGSFQFAWRSGAVISTLTLAGLCFIAFLGWQQWLAQRTQSGIKPIFPLNVVMNRVMGSALVVALLAGFVFYIAVVNIPERSEIVDGVTPVVAGIRLLPMMMASAVGALFAGSMSAKRNYTAHMLVTAAAFQVLGYGLMTTLHGGTDSTTKKLYGFQVFLGLGFGMTMASVTQMTQLQAEPGYIAVTQGALAQVRNLGGSIGLAVAVIIFNHGLRGSSVLAAALTPSQASALFKSPLVITTFSPAQQRLVSMVYADAFTQEMRVALYISAASFLVSLLTLQRNPPQPGRGSLQGPRATAESGKAGEDV